MKTLSVVWFIIIGAFAQNIPLQSVDRQFNKVNVFKMVDGKPLHVGEEEIDVTISKTQYTITVSTEEEGKTSFLIKERAEDVYLVENVHGAEWIVAYVGQVVQMTNGVVGYQFVYEH